MEEAGGARLLRPRGGIWPPLQWRKEMQEDLREIEERVNHTHVITHTHLICHVKVCVTNSLWVFLFEGQSGGEVSHRNVRHVENFSILSNFLMLLRCNTHSTYKSPALDKQQQSSMCVLMRNTGVQRDRQREREREIQLI